MIPFGPFSLDQETQRLFHLNAEVPLRAKSLAVLRELVRRRGRLVTREELFAACWPNIAVSQTVLRVCIAEVRAALAADATGSTSIESVSRRGYRLVAEGHQTHERQEAPIGRDRELAVLRRALNRVTRGWRQIVFITGEAGLGKTTLLEHFVEGIRATSRTRVAWGQCVELTRGTEPYLPFLDLLARLYADDPSGTILPVLERYAPSWLTQMPALVDASQADSIARRAKTANRDRLLREMADALEAITVEEPLVVAIEDLHWSDLASGDVLAYLAQRSTPARLLIVGTYRPADLASGDGSLQSIKQGLVANRGAIEIPLEPLTRNDVDAYLARRLTGSPIDKTFVRSLHARTKGNPLFLTATVDYLLDRGILAVRRGRWEMAEPLDGIVPEGLRQLAVRQLDPLDVLERRVLDAACVTGLEFTVASVAAANGVGPADVEDVCTRLSSRSEIISASGVAAWPDGTISGRYEFRHVLYREVLEEALPMARRQVYHRAIGERLEAAWGEQSAEICAELAIHFEAAGDIERAIRYHVAAGRRARSGFAVREAIDHIRAALAYLRDRPVTPERLATELTCYMDLGSSLTATRGAASTEVLEAFTQAFNLATKVNVAAPRFGAQTAIFSCLVLRADLQRARNAAEDLVATAVQSQNGWYMSIAHVSLGYALFHLAEFAAAKRHFAESHALWRPEFPSAGFDPNTLARCMLGLTALILGEPDLAAEWVRASIERSESFNTPFNLSYAYQLAAQYYATAGQRELALEYATKGLAVASESGYVTHEPVAAIVSGWARRDVDAIRQGIARYEAAEQFAGTSLFRALLIETMLDVGDVTCVPAELTTALAFVGQSGERRHLSELHRLQGEYLRRRAVGTNMPSPNDAARACFDTALAVAREQGARLWELRAAISLADLLVSQGEGSLTRDLIEDCMRPFKDTDELPDLRRAQQLLAAL